MKEIKWKEINPKYGYHYHIFRVKCERFYLIDAKTYRAIGAKEKDEPLWHGAINGAKYGAFWNEQQAIEALEIALEKAGFTRMKGTKNENRKSDCTTIRDDR